MRVFSFISVYLFIVQLAGSQLPNQGLNLGHVSESPESKPLGHWGTPRSVFSLHFCF